MKRGSLLFLLGLSYNFKSDQADLSSTVPTNLYLAKAQPKYIECYPRQVLVLTYMLKGNKTGLPQSCMYVKSSKT